MVGAGGHGWEGFPRGAGGHGWEGFPSGVGGHGYRPQKPSFKKLGSWSPTVRALAS